MIHRYSFTISILLCIAMIMLFFIGTQWGIHRGAHDYQVFYEAGNHIIHGEPLKVYKESSDRFLYAPGFAWIFSLFHYFPKTLGLWAWNSGKLFFIFIFIFYFALFLKTKTPTLTTGSALLIPLLGFTMISRGLLMDYQYGQINLTILLLSSICLLLFISSFQIKPISKKPSLYFLFWFLLSVVSFSKFFSIPLLSLPVLALIKKNKNKYLAPQILGVVFGIIFIFSIPFLWNNFDTARTLYQHWWVSILEKGLPLDGHNQSFYGFLNRVLGDQITFVLFDFEYHFFCFYLLSKNTIDKIGLLWSLSVLVFISFYLIKTIHTPILKNSFLLLSLLILPSHIVWKHYYIFYLPLFLLILVQILQNDFKKWPALILIFSFLIYNFSNFDFIGTNLAARFEAYSTLLWLHLFLFFYVLMPKQKPLRSP